MAPFTPCIRLSRGLQPFVGEGKLLAWSEQNEQSYLNG